jgi:hypothetical protein
MRDPIYEMEEELWRLANLQDGEECGHPGCLSHVTHPCEKCVRVSGKRLKPDKNARHKEILWYNGYSDDLKT